MSIEEFIEIFGTSAIIKKEVPTEVTDIYNSTAIIIDD